MPPRILLVDDDELFLELAMMELKSHAEHFSVQTTKSTSEALRLLERGEYDAVVSDHKMQGMDGLQFLEKLRRNDIETPFIMVTGQGREEVAMRALNLGADSYLMKGANARSMFGELAHIIRRVLRLPETVWHMPCKKLLEAEGRGAGFLRTVCSLS